MAGRSSASPSAARSIICPPAMPFGPAARASSSTRSERTHGSSWVAGSREDLERQRVEAVAGEHRGRLAERLVHCRLAAPKLGIIHARQIVVDQRIDVDRLDRAADPKRALAIDREQARRGDGEQRTKPLAAADRGVAHGVVEALAAVAGRTEQLRKETVDLGRDGLRLGVQLVGEPVDGLNRHRRA